MLKKEYLWYLIRRSMLYGTKPHFVLDDIINRNAAMEEHWIINGAGFIAEVNTKETSGELFELLSEDDNWTLEDVEIFFTFAKLGSIDITEKRTDDTE